MSDVSITLPDGSSRTVAAGTPVREVAAAISPRLAKAALAAMVDGRLVYRVVGIVWGGGKPASGLRIRFRSGEPFVPVTDYQPPASTTTWSIWSHTWRPSSPGVYRVALASGDAAVRARRLDMFFYLREVRIEVV